MRDTRQQESGESVGADAPGTSAPGKRTRAEGLAVQRSTATGDASPAAPASQPWGGDDPYGFQLLGEAAAAEATKGGSDKRPDEEGAAGPRAAASDGAAPATAAAPAAASGGGTPGAAPEAPKQESGSARVTPTVDLQFVSSTDDAEAKDENTKATEAPTFDGAAGENTCQPKTSAAKLDWEAKLAGEKWQVNVTGFTVTGAIKVAPWASKPTQMVTPNTANPVDGGNITDGVGNNNWKFAVQEMEEYNMAGGGRSSFWHAYAASEAHERAHWNVDYMQLCVGKFWPQANIDLDAITIAKADAKDATEAKTKMQAKVDERLTKFRSDMVSEWNGIPDTPGAAQGAGYKAGQAVLDKLIEKVKAYAKTKGWT